MAESFIFSIVESLIEKLASRAFQEASEALDVYDHLREFEKTLSLVKAVLLDAEQKQEHNHELRQWLRQLKSVFYDAEDVLDEFECQTLRKQVLKVHGNIKDEVSHFFSSSNPLVFHCKMAQKIKDCSKRLDKVAADRHKFGLRIIDVDTRDSLSLFVKWAFKEGEEEKHPHLVNITEEIVKKCRGVPLAVRTLRSLLFSMSEANDYDFLPSYLRQCFALFLLYPKDYQFISDEVAKLWGALGLFASPRKNETSEDVVKYIANNGNIKRLPNSICKLQNLQLLNVSGCKELEEFPKGLRKLIVFDIWSEISNLISLALLSIQSCHNMESIFGGVKFAALKTLYVVVCHSVKSLLLDVTNFPELETLFVQDCVNLDLDLWKDHHEEQNPKLKLKLVGFGDLPQLVALPQWLEETANSLHSLFMMNCDNLEMLPEWLSTMTNLKARTISDCPKLISLPDNIHHLTTLEYLYIDGCLELCKKYHPHVSEFWSKI
ncbi:hypothetical protein JHK87_052937 [Glycine soja]|nr:hypothetical protein JHK87_052937 [Glycine soja]